MRYCIICLTVCLLPFTALCQHVKVPFVKGVYGDPAALLEKGFTFKSLGINAIFVRSASLDTDLYEAAKSDSVQVYVEFPTLNGAGYLVNHPEAWPVNEKGIRAPAADWFMGICLTDPGFRDDRIKELKTILREFKVDGIWLDYLHWHAQFETPEPILPETCFCDRCIKQFEKDANIQVPGGDISQRATWILSQKDSSWRVWRTEILNHWVLELKTVLKESRPQALLGIYYCPWYPADFEGAQYRILGLDLKALSGIVDVFSPMLYHTMMKRPPAWIEEYTQWLGSQSFMQDRKTLIWPIVQAENKSGTISTQEFSQVMRGGSRLPSTGIMMFSLHSLLTETNKLEVMKGLYLEKNK